MPAPLAMVAMTVGGLALGSVANQMDSFGNQLDTFAPGSGNSPAMRGLSPTFSGFSQTPESAPMMEVAKMDGYRVKVRGRVADMESISSIGDMFDEFGVNDIREGASLERVERLIDRTRY